jgi:hypothetical protein
MCSPEGNVYCAGPFALGSACAPPILEVHNTTQAPVLLCYGRVPEHCEALESCVRIEPRAFALVAGLRPSDDCHEARLRVEADCGVASFLLVHSPSRGYDVLPLDEGRYRARLRLELRSDPFAPQFCGRAPAWGSDVLVPLRVATA